METLIYQLYFFSALVNIDGQFPPCFSSQKKKKVFHYLPKKREKGLSEARKEELNLAKLDLICIFQPKKKKKTHTHIHKKKKKETSELRRIADYLLYAYLYCNFLCFRLLD